MSNKAVIFDIIRSSFADGPGIRTTVFLKGCSLNCAWCHNPEGISPHPQMMLYRDKCDSCGKCAEICPNMQKSCDLCGKCIDVCPKNARKLSGRLYSAEEIFLEVKKDKIFYSSTGGGVTFSGGEAVLYPDFLAEVLSLCKKEGIHTAVDTSGHAPWENFERILPYTDLFLYDIKHMDSEMHKKYTGAGNSLILSNLARLFELGANIHIRIPIIPDINDSEENILAVKNFLSPYSPEKIELLPYHILGEGKYDALSKPVKRFRVPKKEELDRLYELIKA